MTCNVSWKRKPCVADAPTTHTTQTINKHSSFSQATMPVADSTTSQHSLQHFARLWLAFDLGNSTQVPIGWCGCVCTQLWMYVYMLLPCTCIPLTRCGFFWAASLLFSLFLALLSLLLLFSSSLLLLLLQLRILQFVSSVNTPNMRGRYLLAQNRQHSGGFDVLHSTRSLHCCITFLAQFHALSPDSSCWLIAGRHNSPPLERPLPLHTVNVCHLRYDDLLSALGSCLLRWFANLPGIYTYTHTHIYMHTKTCTYNKYIF